MFTNPRTLICQAKKLTAQDAEKDEGIINY